MYYKLFCNSIGFIKRIHLFFIQKINLVLIKGQGHPSLRGTGTSCKEKFRKENFQTGFAVAGGGFLSYWNHQLIKFDEEKRFGL